MKPPLIRQARQTGRYWKTTFVLLLLHWLPSCHRGRPQIPLKMEPQPNFSPEGIHSEPAQPAPEELSRATPSPLPTEAAPVSSASDDGEKWKPKGEPRNWKYIVLHHTASSRGSVESIHQSHLRRKDSSGNPWLGIGYHFVIGNGEGMEDGAVEPTFRWKQQLHGAHAGSLDFNQRGIGIALIGNFDKSPPTARQLKSIQRLLQVLTERYGVQPEDVVGHGEVKSTRCPGQHFPLPEIRRGLGEKSVGTPRATPDAAGDVDLKRSRVR